MLYKVKCYGCNSVYVLEIGNVNGLRKQYCHYCQTVGRLKIEVEDVEKSCVDDSDRAKLS